MGQNQMSQQKPSQYSELTNNFYPTCGNVTHVAQPINAPSPAGSLRRALEASADLRALLTEYAAYGLPVPASLTAEFEAAQARVEAAVVEDRRQRLLEARAEVDRLRSQEEKLAEARQRLEQIENEVRAAEGK